MTTNKQQDLLHYTEHPFLLTKILLASKLITESKNHIHFKKSYFGFYVLFILWRKATLTTLKGVRCYGVIKLRRSLL